SAATSAAVTPGQKHSAMKLQAPSPIGPDARGGDERTKGGKPYGIAAAAVRRAKRLSLARKRGSPRTSRSTRSQGAGPLRRVPAPLGSLSPAAYQALA